MAKKTFTKPELDAKVVEYLESIIEKFRGKNHSYGDQDDGLYNFRETAREFQELFGEDLLEAQFQVAMVLFHKHFVTLKKNGLKDPEFKDRMGDWIAYGAIMMAMGDLVQEEQPQGRVCTSHLIVDEKCATRPIHLANMSFDEALYAVQKNYIEEFKMEFNGLVYTVADNGTLMVKRHLGWEPSEAKERFLRAQRYAAFQ